MDDTTRTWHYGLVARYWAEHNTTGPEIAYYQKKIERYGQPALDAGCGTGRLLIPFLLAGLDVDGCDISQDMLDLCQEKADKEGLKPALYRQALHELDLPRKYQTIIACGVFAIGGTYQQDFLALQKLYQNLEPGGVLLLDHNLPYSDAMEWQLWLKEARARLPEPWPDTVGKIPPNDGSDYQLFSRRVAFDPLDQRITRQMRTLLWRDGQVIADQEYTLYENLYFYNELLIMIEQVGFKIEAVEGDYKETEVSADNNFMIFTARK